MTPLMWELLQQVFTVETLMTPCGDLLSWEYGTDLSALRAKAKQQRFDLIPVTEGDRIVGLLCGEAEEPEPLTDQWLVSRDTGIHDLLNLFVESGRPGFLVFHRQDVVGLVTPADLNRLPARVYFYNLIGELELALAAYIRRHFAHDPDGILLALSEKRRKDVKEQERGLVKGNVDIDVVEQLYLSDLIDIVEKTDSLRSGLGFPSRKAAHGALGGLNELRRQTMHLVTPVLKRVPDDLTKLHRRVERAKEILHRLEVLK